MKNVMHPSMPAKKGSLIVTAHPDDECMFFLPTVVNLLERGIPVYLLCCSTGNADGLGSTRSKELEAACHSMGIPRERLQIIDDPLLPDSMFIRWDPKIIAAHVSRAVQQWQPTMLITFDSYGVSGHTNHRAVHAGVLQFYSQLTSDNIEIHLLESVNIVRKFIGPLDILVSRLKQMLPTNMKQQECAIFTGGGFQKSYELLAMHASQLMTMCRNCASSRTMSPLWLLFLQIIFASAANVTLNVNLDAREPSSPLTYGIFFEEIGHAGDGGLYNELVQDRSFDAIAAATGFSAGTNLRQQVDLRSLYQASQMQQTSTYPRNMTLSDRRKGGKNDVIVAWLPAAQTSTLTLSKETPLNPNNLVSLEITSTGSDSRAGIINFGYWGIPLVEGVELEVSMFFMTPVSEFSPSEIDVSLISPDGTMVYATSSINAASLTEHWSRHAVRLIGNSNVSDARLAITFDGPGVIRIDVVSCVLAEYVERGKSKGLVTPWPFRNDLFEAINALKPRFLRFPGGCYVEGDMLSARFQWKPALGRIEERSGHMNSMWGYWSVDGLSLFEYLLLAEELNAEPVWVVNNGIAHVDQVPTKDIMPYVQDALDSLEFITGSPESKWGSVRASMGREQPWTLKYLAIGNELCGLPWSKPNPYFKPFGLSNYLVFYSAIKAMYPHINLITSCALHDLGPTEIWEYHVYSNPDDVFSRRHAFDAMTVESDKQVFASEFAVTDGGGHGNLIGAVAEAGFMTGMERNHRVVLGGAYAPLFVNVNSIPWPTNMIWFDNNRWYAIPSYYVQKLFTEHLGTHHVDSELDVDEPVATSVSCLNEECTAVAVKLVNIAAESVLMNIQLAGNEDMIVENNGHMWVLTSSSPEDENSFEHPTQVSPIKKGVDNVAREFSVELQAYSVNVLVINFTMPSSASI